MIVTPWEFDVEWMKELNCDGGWIIDQIMWYASAKLTWVPLYIALVWGVWHKYGWRYAAGFLAAVLLFVLFADQTASFFKNNLSKFRPTHYPPLESLLHTVNGYVGGNFGTVSAHAALSSGIALMSSLVVDKRWVSLCLTVWVLLVCYSRIYLGVHYPMDIFFGLCDGVLWSTVIYFIFKRYFAKKLMQR